MGSVKVVWGIGAVVSVTALVSVFGCSPKILSDSAVLSWLSNIGGLLGCRGCEDKPVLGDVASDLLEGMNDADIDDDGQLSLDEARNAITGISAETFSNLDLDGNGFLDSNDLSGIVPEESVEGENIPVTTWKVEPLEELTIMLPGDVPLEIVRIPAGTFIMGYLGEDVESNSTETPQHQVTIPQDFYMGKYEVTRRQWQAVMKKMRRSSHRVLDDPDSPVVHVSWNDAKSFAEALNAHVKSTGQGNGTFRLPSEAEWEYACRAGTTTDFYWGNDENYDYVKRGNTTISYFRGVDHNHQFAWWYKNTWEANEKYAHKVGQKLPNAWGLYDMIGNASEWCEDLWHIDYTNAPDDGSAWLTDPIARDYLYRVYRGGSWQSEGKELYLHNRSQGHPGYFDNDLGFRIARDLQ